MSGGLIKAYRYDRLPYLHALGENIIQL